MHTVDMAAQMQSQLHHQATLRVQLARAPLHRFCPCRSRTSQHGGRASSCRAHRSRPHLPPAQVVRSHGWTTTWPCHLQQGRGQSGALLARALALPADQVCETARSHRTRRMVSAAGLHHGLARRLLPQPNSSPRRCRCRCLVLLVRMLHLAAAALCRESRRQQPARTAPRLRPQRLLARRRAAGPKVAADHEEWMLMHLRHHAPHLAPPQCVASCTPRACESRAKLRHTLPPPAVPRVRR
jgi:hypothetical protein